MYDYLRSVDGRPDVNYQYTMALNIELLSRKVQPTGFGEGIPQTDMIVNNQSSLQT